MTSPLALAAIQSQPSLYDLIPEAALPGGPQIASHVMLWWGKGSPHFIAAGPDRAPKYDQLDPTFVRADVAAMKRKGITLLIFDTYGPDSYQYPVLQLYRAECIAQDMEWIEALDAGAYQGKATSPIDTINADVALILKDAASHPNYFRFGGRPVIPFFSKSPDTRALFVPAEKAHSNVLFAYNDRAMEAPGTGSDMGWVVQRLDAAQLDYIHAAEAAPADTLHIIPLSPGFNDSKHWPLPVGIKSAWTKKINGVVTYSAARIWPPEGPSLTTFRKYVDNFRAAKIPNSRKIGQILTWNDREEGTFIQPDWDPIAKEYIAGTGLLADVAPTLTRGELWSGKTKIGNFAPGSTYPLSLVRVSTDLDGVETHTTLDLSGVV